MPFSFKNSRFAAFALIALLGTTGTIYYVTQAEAEDAKKEAPAAAAPAADKTAIKDAIKDDKVYASVGETKITGADVKAFVAKLPPQIQGAPATQILPLVVNQLVNDHILDKAVTDAKITDDAEYQKRLAEMTKQVARERFIEKSVGDKVNDTAIKAKYDEMVKKMPSVTEVRARHILVSDEKTANEVLAKLAKGEDFAALAKQYSIDPTKENGGDLGYFVQSAMVKEFGDAAFSMKKGEVSKTAVKTQFGYHIIKVEDSRKQQPPALEQVKDTIRNQVAEENVRKFIDDLRAKQGVKIEAPEAAMPNIADKK